MIGRPKKTKRGRPKKQFSKEVEGKLLNELQNNYDALFRGKGSPKNVADLLTEINDHLKDIQRREPDEKEIRELDRRGLQKTLRKYRDKGITESETKGKNSYYYFKKTLSPAFFWSEILRPFIDKMKIENGSYDWRSPFEMSTRTHIYSLEEKVAILEDGFDITSSIDWLGQELQRDILSEVLNSIEKVVTREIRLRLGDWGSRREYDRLPFQDLVEKLREYFKSKRLAIVYVLDGSKFDVIDKEDLRKQLPFKTEEGKKRIFAETKEIDSGKIRLPRDQRR